MGVFQTGDERKFVQVSRRQTQEGEIPKSRVCRHGETTRKCTDKGHKAGLGFSLYVKRLSGLSKPTGLHIDIKHEGGKKR